jgi:hypothetical protein
LRKLAWVVFAIGRSIIDRSSQLDIGSLMLAHGGGLDPDVFELGQDDKSPLLGGRSLASTAPRIALASEARVVDDLLSLRRPRRCLDRELSGDAENRLDDLSVGVIHEHLVGMDQAQEPRTGYALSWCQPHQVPEFLRVRHHARSGVTFASTTPCAAYLGAHEMIS